MSIELSRQRQDFIGSSAFRIEYRKPINSTSFKKDIESYLGEYRIKLPAYDYELGYSFKEGEGIRLRDPHSHESMVFKALKAIRLREQEGKNTSREQAELNGLLSLEKQLHHAQKGDVILWNSPPGPAYDGYGDYGFIFLGTVGERISMKALRIERPTIDQYNDSFQLLTGLPHRFSSAEQFLASPVVLKNFSANPLAVFSDVFGFHHDEEKMHNFNQLIQRIAPYINEFISMMENGAPRHQLLQAFYAIENFTLFLQENQDLMSVQFIQPQFQQLVRDFSYTPPVAAGSCGNTKSNSVFNSLSPLNSLFSQQDYKNDPSLCRCGNREPHFHCPGKTREGKSCGHPIIVGEGTTTCPKCGTGKIC